MYQRGAARADDGEPAFDALVRVADPSDRLLLDRVRGQTSDLNVLLFTDSTSPIEPTLAEQLETARRLSVAQHSRVVVWFIHEGEVVTVFVAEPAAGRVLVRRIEPSEGRLGGSAQQEAAALVVRSAMRALAAGGEIGVTEQEAAPPPVVVPPPAPKVVGPAPPKPLPPGWELVQFVGARSALDGVAKRGQHSLFGRLAVRRTRLQMELRAALGFSSELDDSIARVSLLRHALSLHGAYVPWESRRVVVSTALGAGANLFIASVKARDAAFDASDSTQVLPVLSADVSLRFMPDFAHQRVGLACMLGVDALPQSLTIGYRDAAGAFVTRDRTWHVLPVASVELVIRMR